MENKESPQISITEEVTLTARERAINDRNLGGETVPAWPAEDSRVPTPSERPSTGKPSRFPYLQKRKGVINK
jgi:hypothetical protein